MPKVGQKTITVNEVIYNCAEDDAKKQNPVESTAEYVSNLILNNRHKMLTRKVYLATRKVEA